MNGDEDSDRRMLPQSQPQPQQANGRWPAIEHIMRGVFFVLTCFVAVIAFESRGALNTIKNHESRISKIEGNRYDSNTALGDTKRFYEKLLEVGTASEARCDNLRAWIENRYPPKYLTEDVSELKKEVSELRTELRQLFRSQGVRASFPALSEEDRLARGLPTQGGT